MSIASVGNGIMNALYSSARPAHAKGGAGSAGDATASAAAPAPDTVTLSSSAQAMASLNARGVTLMSLPGGGLSTGAQPASPAVAADGSVSQSSFEAVLVRFGTPRNQADRDFATMDNNGNGLVSNSEILSAMSQTAQGDDTLSQDLRTMMDTNNDGSVSSSEFVNLETALVSGER